MPVQLNHLILPKSITNALLGYGCNTIAAELKKWQLDIPFFDSKNAELIGE